MLYTEVSKKYPYSGPENIARVRFQIISILSDPKSFGELSHKRSSTESGSPLSVANESASHTLFVLLLHKQSLTGLLRALKSKNEKAEIVSSVNIGMCRLMDK